MASYKITSSAGVDMGTWEAESPEAAIEAMHQDAGYRDSEHAADALGTNVDALCAELTIEEVAAYELVVGSDERGWMSPTGEPEVYATESEAEWARSQIASDRADEEHTADEIAATIRIREVA